MSLPVIGDARIFICVGSGGVGKTTVAAGLGVMAAQAGRRVLVLTIDPSKRLASTLGLEGVCEITKVPGQKYAGELWAGTIDHKRIFDDFVRRAAQKSPTAEKLLKNRLYQQLSTTLSGSQEFTALEKLLSVSQDPRFDLIILDTPPAAHAMDFLEAPGQISMLFSEGIAKWFREPKNGGGFLQGLLQTGTKQVLKVLETLTGNEFIHELSDFFSQIEGWQDRLVGRTTEVHRLLTAASTQFALVTSFDRAKLKEAEDFSKDIRQGGHHLAAVILNRAFPDWLDRPKDPLLQGLHDQFVHYYAERNQAFQDFAARLKSDVRVFQLPEYLDRIYDLQGLELVAQTLSSGGAS